MSQYFPPYRSFRSNTKAELNLSSSARKANLKNTSHIDIRNFALKSNLSAIKSKVDKLDIWKLTPVPNYSAKLNNLV